MSWSQISSFEYDKEKWYVRYYLGKKSPETAEMRFGKVIGEKLASDPLFIPDMPRFGKFEEEFRTEFNGIKLVGFADTSCPLTFKKIGEYKSGVKPWDQKRVDTHGQIDMYLFLNYMIRKIRPEEVECFLGWLPTEVVRKGHFGREIRLIEPVVPQIFYTERSLVDILNFGSRIKKTVAEMEEYIKSGDN